MVCVFALNFIFGCYALFFAFSLLSDEGVPSWRGVDLSLVVTLYGVYVLVFGFWFFIYIFLINKHIYAETRSGNDVMILSC